MYSINSTDLSTFGITAIRDRGEAYAVKGLLDFPKRKGNTSHDWGTEVEAFVSTDDMIFEGRDVTFSGLMTAQNKTTLSSNLTSFINLCKSGQLTFVTPLGTATVYLTGAIRVEEINPLTYYVECGFHEPVITFSSAGSASGGAGYLLENYNLKTDFGITVERIKGRKSESERIQVQTTDFYTGVARQDRVLSLDCFISATDLSTLKDNMAKFHGLLATSGLKTLTDLDGNTYETYLVEGFKVNMVPGAFIGKFTLNLRS